MKNTLDKTQTQLKYWKQRQKLPYFKRVIDLTNSVENVRSVLDVGGGSGWMLHKIFPGAEILRTLVDPFEIFFEPCRRKPYIHIRKPFLETDLGKFDVVICCQVMEHLIPEIRAEFACKLLESAQRRLIVSIPYQWTWTKHEDHRGLDEGDVMDWFGRGFYKEIVGSDSTKGRIERLICLWDTKF